VGEKPAKKIRGGSGFSETVQRPCLVVERVGRSSGWQSSSTMSAVSQLASRLSVVESGPPSPRGWRGVASWVAQFLRWCCFFLPEVVTWKLETYVTTL